jgi:hypothetical protein
MQGGGIKIDLRPFELAKLGSSQSVSKRHKQHRGIPMPVTIRLCRLDQLLNLTGRQVFAATILTVGQSCGRNCSVYSSWRH